MRLVVVENRVQDLLHLDVVIIKMILSAPGQTSWRPVEYLPVDIVVLVHPHGQANTGDPVHSVAVVWTPPAMRGIQLLVHALCSYMCVSSWIFYV